VDPWLSQRYAGVDKPATSRPASPRATTSSRRARREADELLDDLAREVRRRRARRALSWSLGVIVVVAGLAWAASTVGLV
jgi:hypothetical protein